MFGPDWEEVTGSWIKLHNEDMNDLYCSPDIIAMMTSRNMRSLGHVSRIGERIHRLSARKPELKTFGRSRSGWGIIF